MFKLERGNVVKMVATEEEKEKLLSKDFKEAEDPKPKKKNEKKKVEDGEKEEANQDDGGNRQIE